MTTSPNAPAPAFAALNQTHDPALKSWVASANDPATDFPIQNLPLCVFAAEHDGHRHNHLGVAIGDSVLDVSMLMEAGWIEREDKELAPVFAFPYWTRFAAFPEARPRVRALLQKFLLDGPAAQPMKRLREKALRPLNSLKFLPPMTIFNYTDFYASIDHATTVGSMFRPDQPLLPNYKWIPIGYHGRASSIVVSGAPIVRPTAQQSPPEGEATAPPKFGPCAMLDYELEVGAFLGPGNTLGKSVPIAEAHNQLVGLCLVNDWSARDVQKWEYQPLGPFLAKNFATQISPFLVTAEALAPFRCPASIRPDGDPAPLPYLSDDADRAMGGFDITLEVLLQTQQMAASGVAPQRLSHGNFQRMYWTFAQMIAHHTVNGCNLQPGDLIASGTISGKERDTKGCLLELTWDGPGKPRSPVELPTGEKRTFLQDGDTIIMRGWCERTGHRRIGLGECRGTIVAS